MAKQSRTWLVEFDSDAVIDFEDVKWRGDRKAVFNVVQKLKDLGPALPSPHMKSLKGEADLFIDIDISGAQFQAGSRRLAAPGTRRAV